MDEQNEQQEELDMTRSAVEAELSMIDSDLGKRLTERGQFQAETNVSTSYYYIKCIPNRSLKKAHERKLGELTNLVDQLMAHYGLSGTFASDPVSNAHQVVLALQSKMQQLTSAMESWKTDKKAKESTYLSEIQNMKAVVASHEETRKMFKRQMESCKDKIKGIQRDIGQYYVSETEMNGLKVVLQEEEAALATLNAAFSPGQSELQLKSLSADLQTHELKLMQINEEMSTLSNQSSMRARLELKQTERDRKKLSLVSMQEPANQSFATILGVVPEPAQLERKLSDALL
jgi:DNA repair protein RAD50